MYSFIHGMYTSWTPNREYSVLVLGLKGVGKTTLVDQIRRIFLGLDRRRENVNPTRGLNVSRIVYWGIRWRFWDLSGDRGFENIWRKYLESSDGLIFMLDSTDTEGIDESIKVLGDLVDRNNPMPVLVLANKQDQEKAEDLDVIQKRIEELGIWNVGLGGISAVNRDGILKKIEWLFGEIMELRKGQQ